MTDIFAINQFPIACFTFIDTIDFTILEGNQHFFDFIGYSSEVFHTSFGNRVSAICEASDFSNMNMMLSQMLTEGKTSVLLEGRIRQSGVRIVYTAFHVQYDGRKFLCAAYDLSNYIGKNTVTNLKNLRLSLSLKAARIDSFSYDFEKQIVNWHTDIPIFPEEKKVDIFSYFIEAQIIYFEDMEPLRETLHKLEELPEKLELELRMRIHDDYRWFRLHLVHEDTSDDSRRESHKRYLCVLEDICYLKEEQKNHASDLKIFNHFLDTTAAYGVVDITENYALRVGGIWTLYEEVMDTLSYGELIRTYVNKVAHPLDKEEYLQLTAPENYKKQYAQGERVLTCKFRRIENNQMSWMQLMVHLYEDEVTRHLMAIMYLTELSQGKRSSEISAQRLPAESKILREDFEEYLNIHGEAAYLVYPKDYTFICGNRAFYQTFQLNQENCYGLKCYTLLYGKDSPCEFCTRGKWSYDDYCCCNCWNPVIEQELLIKNKLINLKNQTLLLALTTRVSTPMTTENISVSEHRLLEYISRIASAGDIKDIYNITFEMISCFFEAEYVSLCEYDFEEKLYKYTLEWKKKDSVPLNRTSPAILPDEAGQDFKLENVEMVKAWSAEKYKILKAYNIVNLQIIPIRKSADYEGYIYMLNFKANFQNSTFLTSVVDYLNLELKKRRLFSKYTYNYAHDIDTGLLNRRSFEEYSNTYSEDGVSTLAVISADINDLKSVNSTLGQKAGDELIVKLAQILGGVFSAGDDSSVHLFRLSGDEFLIIMEDSSLEEFLEKIEELKKCLEETANRGLSVALGYTWNQVEKDLNDVIFQANNLMQIDKQRYYDNKKLNNNGKRYQMMKTLLESIAAGEYLAFLQPKVDLETNKIIGAEALVRYQPCGEGIQPPSKFIPMLEEHNLIRYIDLFIFEEVCTILAKWKAEGKKLLPISLNFSRLTILESGIIESIESIIKKYDIPKQYVEIEITETVGKFSKNVIINVVNSLKKNGYNILLDDFGTKYTNLSMLTEVNFDELKIDRGLINTLAVTKTNQIVVKNVIAMCKDLGKKVIAEGIENQEQEKMLHYLGCTRGQGYLYGKPLPLHSFEALLSSEKS